MPQVRGTPYSRHCCTHGQCLNCPADMHPSPCLQLSSGSLSATCSAHPLSHSSRLTSASSAASRAADAADRATPAGALPAAELSMAVASRAGGTAPSTCERWWVKSANVWLEVSVLHAPLVNQAAIMSCAFCELCHPPHPTARTCPAASSAARRTNGSGWLCTRPQRMSSRVAAARVAASVLCADASRNEPAQW